MPLESVLTTIPLALMKYPHMRNEDELVLI